MFSEHGFEVEELDVCCKQVENRSRELVMNRRWVQATFRLSNDDKNQSEQQNNIQLKSDSDDQTTKETVDNTDIDISDGLAMEMFGASPSNHEVREDLK